MRALILTFGTRGDIDPFAALAARLTEAGHTATLAAPEPYRGTVAPAVGFEPMATEMDRIMRAGMTTLRGPSESWKIIRQMTAAMRTSLVEQWDIAQRTRPTVIVAHPKALGGFHIAERLGIPFVASLPLPFLTPTGDFPIPFLARPLPRTLNRATYQFNRSTALAYGGMINRFRRDQLGLARMSRFSDYSTTRNGQPVPVLYPVSPHVVPVPHDYPDTAHLTGYWLKERSEGWRPPEELVDFLRGDGPVVYLGFGSMGFGGDAENRGHTIVSALQAAGVRAVVANGWGALRVESGGGVLVVDDVPHDWLFPRVDAVVHHGGSGTTAAGLRAGKPTLICPVLGDQPFWGRRVHELGVGPEPLPLKKLTSPLLAERIRELVSTPAYAEAAENLGQKIAQEDGVGVALALLEAIDAHEPVTRRSGPSAAG